MSIDFGAELSKMDKSGILDSLLEMNIGQFELLVSDEKFPALIAMFASALVKDAETGKIDNMLALCYRF